jgi:hypothetical protein
MVITGKLPTVYGKRQDTTALLGLLDPEDESTMTLQNIENPMTHWHIPIDSTFQQNDSENLKSPSTTATNKLHHSPEFAWNLPQLIMWYSFFVIICLWCQQLVVSVTYYFKRTVHWYVDTVLLGDFREKHP